MRWWSRSFSSSVSLPTFKFRRASAFQKYSTNLKTLPRQGFIKNRGQSLNHRGFRSPTLHRNHHTDTKICPNQGPVPQRGTCALCMQSGDRQMLEGKHMDECEWLWLGSFPSATLLSEYINLGSCREERRGGPLLPDYSRLGRSRPQCSVPLLWGSSVPGGMSLDWMNRKTLLAFLSHPTGAIILVGFN